MIINKLSYDNFKKNRHKIDTALNNRHSPLVARDELKKYVRNVWYLGYILNLRNFFKKENNFFFAMGFKNSEFPYRIFDFSYIGTFLQDYLHFASLWLLLMHGTMLCTLLIIVGQALHLFCRKEKPFVVVCNRLLSAIM